MNSLNLRIIHTHDTEENWNKTVEFIPKAGEVIVYDVDNTFNYERFKIGDGVTVVQELPFTITAAIGALFSVEDNVIIADAGRVTQYEQNTIA